MRNYKKDYFVQINHSLFGLPRSLSVSGFMGSNVSFKLFKKCYGLERMDCDVLFLTGIVDY